MVDGMNKDDVVRIFDTTLRDGEQSPGASMNPEEKLMLARLPLPRMAISIRLIGYAGRQNGRSS